MTVGVIDPNLRFRDLVASEETSWAADQPDWLVRLRKTAADHFGRHGFPNPRDEAWRYTSLDFLRHQPFVPARRETPEPVGPADMAPFALAGRRTARLVFVNGRYSDALSDSGPAGQGILAGSLRQRLAGDPGGVGAHLGRLGGADADAFGALNAALMEDGAFVHISAGTQVEHPIEILHISAGADEPRIVHPRHVVVLEAGASAAIAERYVALGDDASYFNNVVIEISLGEGAELRHDRLQEESGASYHLAGLRIEQAAASRYRQVTAALGGIWARTGITLTFAGEQAAAAIDGLYVARDRQLNDVHLDVRHEVPRCESRESFKGILDGRGRAVFDGRVLVARDAQQTDARLSNDNLLLSRNAEVDTKPQLEIYADDVRCSHGTTVGQLDEAMLFYLRSRGIGREAARQMLCLGFAGEVLDAFDTPELRERARALLQRRLERVADEVA